ncbi:hypothetical protein DPMN_023285 [Dreissena polymorpha]|uniref:Uncharacterized protein n=1 Tax=Dreissena polymorpha TaxID=45954 RepID=A0A9D4RB90_DREPO|nr:hypothetical protein DPMN_023285 [Dreissena polymorpha]
MTSVCHQDTVTSSRRSPLELTSQTLSTESGRPGATTHGALLPVVEEHEHG